MAAFTAFAVSSQATIVSFDPLAGTIPNYGYVPDGYGSTPQVAVSYETLDTSLNHLSSHLQFWNSGYDHWPTAAYSDGDGLYGQVTLTPVAGYTVTLGSFEMAAYPTGTGTRSEATIDVIYGSGILHYAPTSLSMDTATTFSPNLTYAGPVTIRFGTDWNNGINYIDFTASPVPEPSTYVAGAMLLLPFGLSGIRILRKSRKV